MVVISVSVLGSRKELYQVLHPINKSQLDAFLRKQQLWRSEEHYIEAVVANEELNSWPINHQYWEHNQPRITDAIVVSETGALKKKLGEETKENLHSKRVSIRPLIEPSKAYVLLGKNQIKMDIPKSIFELKNGHDFTIEHLIHTLAPNGNIAWMHFLPKRYDIHGEINGYAKGQTLPQLKLQDLTIDHKNNYKLHS